MFLLKVRFFFKSIKLIQKCYLKFPFNLSFYLVLELQSFAFYILGVFILFVNFFLKLKSMFFLKLNSTLGGYLRMSFLGQINADYN